MFPLYLKKAGQQLITGSKGSTMRRDQEAVEICTGLDNLCGLVGAGTAGIGMGCHHPTQDQPADPRVRVAGTCTKLVVALLWL